MPHVHGAPRVQIAFGGYFLLDAVGRNVGAAAALYDGRALAEGRFQAREVPRTLVEGRGEVVRAYKDRSALCGSSAFQWSRRKPVLGGGALLAFSFWGVAFVVKAGLRRGDLTGHDGTFFRSDVVVLHLLGHGGPRHANTQHLEVAREDCRRTTRQCGIAPAG